VLEHDLALVYADEHRVQAQGFAAGQFRGDLVRRANVAGQVPDDLGTAAKFLPQRPEVSQRVGDVVIVVPGPVAVRDRLVERRQVASARDRPLRSPSIREGHHHLQAVRSHHPQQHGL